MSSLCVQMRNIFYNKSFVELFGLEGRTGRIGEPQNQGFPKKGHYRPRSQNTKIPSLRTPYSSLPKANASRQLLGAEDLHHLQTPDGQVRNHFGKGVGLRMGSKRASKGFLRRASPHSRTRNIHPVFFLVVVCVFRYGPIERTPPESNWASGPGPIGKLFDLYPPKARMSGRPRFWRRSRRRKDTCIWICMHVYIYIYT